MHTCGAAAEVAAEVNMIALLPISMPGGRTVAGALELAVQRVNADPSLLPGLTLKYTYGDSGCSGPKAMTALAHL